MSASPLSGADELFNPLLFLPRRMELLAAGYEQQRCCVNTQDGDTLVSSRLARALDLVDRPGGLHPLGLVVVVLERVEGVDLDDLLAQLLGFGDHLGLFGGRLALGLAARRKVAISLARERHGTRDLIHAVAS